MARTKLTPEQIAQVAYDAGFRGEDLAIAVAIALAESSGYIDAHNPNGEDSRGLWQINVDAHGSRFGSPQSLFDPTVNARAAYALYKSSGFQPWTTYTGATESGKRNSYTRHLETAEAAASKVSGGQRIDVPVTAAGSDDVADAASSTATILGDIPYDPAFKNMSDAEIEEHLRRDYGYLSWLLDDPELGPLIIKGAREGWDDSRWYGAVSQTRWWRENSESIRTWLALEGEDPATAEEEIERRAEAIRLDADRMGLPLSEQTVRDIARSAAMYQWTEEELASALAAEARRSPGRMPTGDLEVLRAWAIDKSYAYLSPYGIEVPQRDLERMVVDLWEGRMSEEGFERWLRGQAVAANPNIAPFLRAGYTPREAKQRIDQAEAIVTDLAGRFGITLNAQASRGLAQQAVLNAWSDAQLRDAVLDEFEFDPSAGQPPPGELAAIQDELFAMAKRWLVPISAASAWEWAVDIARGEATQEGFQSFLLDQAQGRFPHLASTFGAGVTPDRYFDPYREEIARLLEVTPDSIDLLNPKWSRIIEFVPEGKDERRPMTMYELQRYVRDLPEWSGTRQAQAGAAEVGEQILQTFGAVDR